MPITSPNLFLLKSRCETRVSSVTLLSALQQQLKRRITPCSSEHFFPRLLGYRTHLIFLLLLSLLLLSFITDMSDFHAIHYHNALALQLQASFL